ncbi:MAG TPA: polysaccharide deacetylase family protein [Gammaproteobacteria bacterium]|nr:polysaccharide deacetylase family protein [Gammaproteobacteria bacterium]
MKRVKNLSFCLSRKSWTDLFSTTAGIIRRGSRLEPYIYLSFDDGPDPAYTPRLLDILAACDIHASFFVVGLQCRRHPDLLRRITDEGHTLGNHGCSHLHPWAITAGKARQEVRMGFDIIADICNRAPRFFRPPYGRLRKSMLDEARALGTPTVLWNRSAMDWGIFGKPSAVARRLAKTERGDILLLHDAIRLKNRPAAALRLLPDFIAACGEQGLRFEKLDRLASAGAGQTLLTSTGALTASSPEPSNFADNGKALIKETSTAAR